MMRGMWYVFRANDGIGLHQFLADAVQEIMHGPGGWLVFFKSARPNAFLSRREFSAPFLSRRVRI